jgi:DNA-binding PadR family transcriptional regulator
MELLTKLEELVLIAVLKLGKTAYGISIYNVIAELTGREVALSSVYFPLERLVRKGYLQAVRGEPSPKRGGMGKRFYRLTRPGLLALQENRAVSDAAWRSVAELLDNLSRPSPASSSNPCAGEPRCSKTT